MELSHEALISKVLIICSTDIVKKEGAAYSRYRLYGKAIVSCGHQATIVSTLNPIYKGSIVIEDGVEYWGRQAKRIDNFFLRNLRNNLTFWPSAIFLLQLFIIKGLKMDAVIWAPKGLFIDIFAVFLIRCICHTRIFVEMNELQSSIVKNSVCSHGGILQSLLEYILYGMAIMEDKLFRYYSGAIAISTRLYNMMIKRQPNTVLIPILVDDVKPEDKLHNIRSKDVFKIGFFGTLSVRKEGLDLFLDALSRLKREGALFKFDMYGTSFGKYQNEIQFLVTKHGLIDEVSIHDAVPHIDVMDKLVECNLLVLPRTVNKQTMFGFSTKLGEYLLSGVPVLVTDVSDNGLFIKNGVNGLIVKPDSVSAILDALRNVLKNRQETEIMGSRGRLTAINKFGYPIHAKKLVSFILGDTQ